MNLLRSRIQIHATTVLVALAATLLLTAAPAGAAYQVGDVVPEITLDVLGGGTMSLGDLRGRVVLLTFFTTWCETCPDEAVVLQQEWEELRPIGLTVVGIDSGDAPPYVQQWVDALGLDYFIWLTPNWTLFEEFAGSSGMPYNMLLDADGILRYVREGFDHDSLMEAVHAWLPGATPADVATWGGVKSLYR